MVDFYQYMVLCTAGPPMTLVSSVDLCLEWERMTEARRGANPESIEDPYIFRDEDGQVVAMVAAYNLVAIVKGRQVAPIVEGGAPEKEVASVRDE